MANFRIDTDQDSGRVTLSLTGELDLAAADEMESELSRVEQGRPPLVVVDLRNLRFMDSTGLRLLVAADTRAREAGRRFALIQGPEAVERVFQITKLDERLEIVADPAELDGIPDE